MNATKKLSPEVQTAIREADIRRASDGLWELRLFSQLPRAVYTATDKALREAGGVWQRKVKAHVFTKDPTQVLAQYLDAGEYTDRQKLLQQFWTPSEVAKAAAAWLFDEAPEPGDLLLEPSAGTGELMRAAARHVDESQIDGVEVDSLLAPTVAFGCRSFYWQDFLKMDDLPAKYRWILMNPPFADQQDIEHVSYALSKLRPTGPVALVAIMSPTWQTSETKRARAFRAELQKWKTEVRELPVGAFKESGTHVRTTMLRVWRDV